MSKHRFRIRPSRLGIRLLLYFMLSTALAVGLYFCLERISGNFIETHLNNTKAAENKTKLELESFQAYVTENALSSDDTSAIYNWVYREKYVLMNIYKDELLVFSYPYYIKGSYKFKIDSFMPSYNRLYRVTFSDGAAQVGISLLVTSKYYNAAQVVSLLLSFICFVVFFLALISSKFKYINRLQNELKIIESGNLDYPVTIRGTDEIALLAQSIDCLRKSFAERTFGEKEARRLNSELITSISHDLRTPLTILVGYLDVLADGKYQSGEQFHRYIESSRQKAYQLKELSDKLFEYFLAYGGEYRDPELKELEFSPLITQIIAENALSLEDHGLKVVVTGSVPPCVGAANPIAVHRVFGNLFNNILKYASRDVPVTVSFDISAHVLSVIIKNASGAQTSSESTNIGLATCEKIMAQHKGTFTVRKSDGEFTVTVGFPIRGNPI